MRLRNGVIFASLAAAALLAAGCGGSSSSGSPAPAAVAGGVGKGPVFGASVFADTVDMEISTDQDGNYSIQVLPSGTTIIRFTGGTYYDAALGGDSDAPDLAVEPDGSDANANIFTTLLANADSADRAAVEEYVLQITGGLSPQSINLAKKDTADEILLKVEAASTNFYHQVIKPVEAGVAGSTFAEAFRVAARAWKETPALVDTRDGSASPAALEAALDVIKDSVEGLTIVPAAAKTVADSAPATVDTSDAQNALTQAGLNFDVDTIEFDPTSVSFKIKFKNIPTLPAHNFALALKLDSGDLSTVVIVPRDQIYWKYTNNDSRDVYTSDVAGIGYMPEHLGQHTGGTLTVIDPDGVDTEDTMFMAMVGTPGQSVLANVIEIMIEGADTEEASHFTLSSAIISLYDEGKEKAFTFGTHAVAKPSDWNSGISALGTLVDFNGLKVK